MEGSEDSENRTVVISQTSSLKIPRSLLPSDLSSSSPDLVALADAAQRAALLKAAALDDDFTLGLRQRHGRGGRAGAAKDEQSNGEGGRVGEEALKEGESTAESQATDEKATEKKKPRRHVSSPVHTQLKDSPLSSTAIFRQSHAGLVNLCVVVLVAVNGRLILENLLKYGIMVRANFWFAVASWRDWPLLVCGLSLNFFPAMALFIEWLNVYAKIPERLTLFLHASNIFVEFFYPCAVILSLEHVQPLGSFILIFITVITMMKLISYAHTNYNLRSRLRDGQAVEEAFPGQEKPLSYPNNLTFGNMVYFICAPTLCYQLGYPRTKEIRKTVLAQHISQLLAFLCLMVIIIEQYMSPTIQNSKHPFRGHLLESAERVLRLSLPSLYMWLCVFYTFFHLWLNIIAEVLRFGDRDFYKDWWNARTIEEYWRLWNMPVHRWMARHVFFPCLSRGWSKHLAMLLVFFLSAVFHEVLVGIPCRMFRLWAFIAMMFQIPLVALTNFLYQKYQNPIVGNMIFWFIFCIVGQPMAILLYYHDVQLLAKGAT